MSEPFVGQIQAFAFGIIPKYWAACNGQTLSIQQNQALYSVLGVTYGGDGVMNFKLPDLRGRVAAHVGQGITLGRAGGEEAHVLTINEIPVHNHQAMASKNVSSSNKPTGNVWGTAPTTENSYTASPNALMSLNALDVAGGDQGHSNLQPYLALNYCIALSGIYPTRE